MLAATNLNHPEVRNAPVKPTLAAAFYPGCSTELRAGYQAAAPLLLQIGEGDDWTPTEPCRQLAAQATGTAVTFHAYPGSAARRPSRCGAMCPMACGRGRGYGWAGSPRRESCRGSGWWRSWVRSARWAPRSRLASRDQDRLVALLNCGPIRDRLP